MQFWAVRLWLSCVSVLFLFAEVTAVNLYECQKDKFANGTKQITYQQCTQVCGGGVGDFKWTMFSQEFSTWLLPWIALMSQLPFGATDRVDNLVSVFMAIGSPALAGYSLAITRLNNRWLSRQFTYLRFPNRENIPLAVSALQHIPFRIDPFSSFLPSLIVLPQNDRYWRLLATAAKRTRQWSIPVAMNILWALVAFSFTIVDSFVDFDSFINFAGDAGYSISAVWTYLLPLVVGWLYVGSQPEANHLRDALLEAHEIAYVATASEPILATRDTGRSTRAIEYSTRHIDHVNADEEKSTPVFNYSRVFIWSQHAEFILRLFEDAAANASRKIPVQQGREWASESPDHIIANDRIGNETEVVRYCTEMPNPAADFSTRRDAPQFPAPSATSFPFPPSPEPSAAAFLMDRTYSNNVVPEHMRVPSSLSKFDEETLYRTPRAVSEKPVFATGVFRRVLLATILGLSLQWGTTGASILIHYNTPPKGMGCRVLTFVLYGAAGTLSFFLLLISSILGHLVRRQTTREARSFSTALIGFIVALMRWSGKVIAIVNGLGLLVSCAMQFAGMYDNCFCTSTIFGGDPNGTVSFLLPGSSIKGSQVYWYWIGGTVMAFGISGLYSFAIYVATPME